MSAAAWPGERAALISLWDDAASRGLEGMDYPAIVRQLIRWLGEVQGVAALSGVPRRYDQCSLTCTVDCGHCKGQGPPWRATSSGRLLGRNPDRIERHGCGCVTGWDDAYEQCVLLRCGGHRLAAPLDASQSAPVAGGVA